MYSKDSIRSPSRRLGIPSLDQHHTVMLAEASPQTFFPSGSWQLANGYCHFHMGPERLRAGVENGVLEIQGWIRVVVLPPGGKMCTFHSVSPHDGQVRSSLIG